MELKGENLWSISDDFLFVACGLLVSAAHAGTSVYITWNKYYLLNIRFKDRKDTSRKKITVMRIPLPILGGNYIKSVHTLSFVNENTQELYFKDERLHHCATKNNLCGTLESRDASAIYYFKKHIISNTAKLDIEDSLKYNDFTFDKIMTETELLYGLNCYDVLNSSTKMAINPRYFAIRNAFF
ncbi:uncharacterized protein LOC108024369 isoform X25 [Drosophila biarmipes]|uniref:uncharacterized protein LOC108024369 isoform X25 n=1 Tax=Drosophila biarmipes TaxID=125945 RepID=UPI001CDAD7A8|nr:uncharacterized protein LOC108024369 isoform X25 [Drosophila biarmipes]